VTLADSLRTAGFKGQVRAEAPLAPFTTWQIGGPAEVLAVPHDEQDLALALGWAAQGDIPWRLLGNGSNLLVHDDGVRGLVLRVRKALDAITVSPPHLTAGAGASYPAVANMAAAQGLAGLEFAAGIPGTLGGAIVMNAGWHRFETGNTVTQVRFLHADGRQEALDHDACRFTYRGSIFRGLSGIVLEATFSLQPGEPAAIRAEVDRYTASRKTNQPVDKPSCGSVYLKPENDFAGRLIEVAGLKGLRHGGLQVSRLHANFFINMGGGTCADAMAFMDEVETRVLQHSGVRLIREVEFWS
jgi:UDP-N-acetylmuramate dehydrogenase